MPVILMDDLVDRIKAGGKQPLCDLSIGSWGTTFGIICAFMFSALILHSFFFHFLNFPVVFRAKKSLEALLLFGAA